MEDLKLSHQAALKRLEKFSRFTDSSIKEIAFDLGYDNPYYFSRIFKKRTQMNPEEFRKAFAESCIKNTKKCIGWP